MADNSGDSVFAFMLGGVVGAALGLLLAPHTGDETRRRLMDWLEESRERTKRLLDEERAALKHQKDRIDAAWHAGKQAFREEEPAES